MRAALRRLLARLAPKVGPDHPDFEGDHPAPPADPFRDHPPQCKCYFHR